MRRSGFWKCGENVCKKNKSVERRREAVEKKWQRKRGGRGEKDDMRLSHFQMISNETQSALASCKLFQPLCNRPLKLD